MSEKTVLCEIKVTGKYSPDGRFVVEVEEGDKVRLPKTVADAWKKASKATQIKEAKVKETKVK